MRTEDTDIHILAADPAKSLLFPGPRPIESEDLEIAKAIIEAAEPITRDDFMVQVLGDFWRGRRDRRAVDGMWLRMRRMSKVAPTLDTLPSPLPKGIKAALMSPSLTRGGLVHVAGGPGCGKTHTASATLVSRLHEFGGKAFTVEEPPELPLHGFHGKGYCTQTWVAGDLAADWTESMRGALRSQPAGTNLIMYVGEVRDAETAQAMLRAASNGFLVISTGFGADIVSGIDTFFQLLGGKYATSLAGILRMVVYQKILGERFTAEALVSESPGSPVAALIRSGQLAQLQNEITYQQNRMVAGKPLFEGI